MLTSDQVKEICRLLSLEVTGTPDDANALFADVSQVVFRREVTDCGDAVFAARHIDLEYSFGDYCEIAEGTPLFGYISGLCPLPEGEEETEVLLYGEE